MDNAKLPTNIEIELKALTGDCETPKDLIQKMMKMEQAPCPVTHTFNEGSYIRELNVKAGTFIVGHSHRTSNINLFVKGKIALMNEDGSYKILIAPMYFIAPPGRKIAYVVEDMTWVNIHATTLTDVNEVEEQIYDKSIMDGIDFKKMNVDRIADHLSYHEAIERLGFTHEQVQSMVHLDNVENIHNHSSGFKIDESDIDGQGVFATMDYPEGAIIGSMRQNNKRTFLGRYTNHSANPNAIAVKGSPVDPDCIFMVAIKPINGCKGGLNGDEITIDYEHTFNLSSGRIK